jgi:hypothetical protein
MNENLKKTSPEVRPFVAMFVGLPPALASHCESLVAPLAVVRVNDALEATVRMLSVRPLVVVASGDKDAPSFASLRERCKDVRAVLTVLPEGSTLAFAEAMISAALRMGTR